MSIHDLTKINELFNQTISVHKLKNDAGLARFIDVSPVVISKTRWGSLKFGATMLLRFHETTGTPVKKLRAAIEV